MNARPIKRTELRRRMDPIFGKVPDIKYIDVWRVQVEIGRDQFFVSEKKYANEKPAAAAARRINQK